MPLSKIQTDQILPLGAVIWASNRVVQPDPGCLQNYQTHAGQSLGHWPSSPEITAAMFERAAQLRTEQKIAEGRDESKHDGEQ